MGVVLNILPKHLNKIHWKNESNKRNGAELFSTKKKMYLVVVGRGIRQKLCTSKQYQESVST